jgi:hypothetical protein
MSDARDLARCLLSDLSGDWLGDESIYLRDRIIGALEEFLRDSALRPPSCGTCPTCGSSDPTTKIVVAYQSPKTCPDPFHTQGAGDGGIVMCPKCGLDHTCDDPYHGPSQPPAADEVVVGVGTVEDEEAQFEALVDSLVGAVLMEGIACASEKQAVIERWRFDNAAKHDYENALDEMSKSGSVNVFEGVYDYEHSRVVNPYREPLELPGYTGDADTLGALDGQEVVVVICQIRPTAARGERRVRQEHPERYLAIDGEDRREGGERPAGEGGKR